MLVDSWMKLNKRKCNLDKSNNVIFERKPQQLLTDIHGAKIENCVKYLGINIDEDLNFKYHVRRIKKKHFICKHKVF